MRRWLKFGVIALLVVIGIVVVAMLMARRMVAQSLPILDGEIEISGLQQPVCVDRDQLGVPTIRAANRVDASRALGFLHAQDRFFQMDLMRRQGAGELAELVGAAAVEVDLDHRLHRFRWRAQRAIAEMPASRREVLAAYASGVNQGLEALGASPFEYILLGAEPQPWLDEDSLLVAYGMYFTLTDSRARFESTTGLIRDLLPPDLADFLLPFGTGWDAPVVGEAFAGSRIPEAVGPVESDVSYPESENEGADGVAAVGSNNWAVAGWRTADGRAILANDMHLGLGVPNTWYRVAMEWTAKDESPPARRMVGVSLPGSPMIVVGSNGHLAWGFTNSYGDWTDLVVLETDPDDAGRYRTADGFRDIERHTETVAVRGEEPRQLEVRTTIWGPIIDEDHLQRPRALRWIAHDQGAVNLEWLDLENVRTVEEAQAVANRSGIPPQNFVCADESGSIGWTIAGRIPERSSPFGRVPRSWADGAHGWIGWLDPEFYPRIVDPPDGIIWTANSRVVGGEMLAIIGDGGYDLGARAGQIRDGLLAQDSADELAMLAIQLDDRAVFLDRWRQLVLEVLSEDAIEGHPQRRRFRDLVEKTWTGRADIQSVGYRLVRAFRLFTFERVYGSLTADCARKDDEFDVDDLSHWEGPLWQLLTQRPRHMLDSEFESWSEMMLAVVDATVDYFDQTSGGELEDQTWGARNTVRIRHPLSYGVPWLSKWLDMPVEPLPGDSNMPRVQSPAFGASQRLAVAPGHEEDGYFHMPAGQSGHPLSPFYSAGHDDWARGRPVPFLPGDTQSVLQLIPATVPVQ